MIALIRVQLMVTLVAERLQIAHACCKLPCLGIIARALYLADMMNDFRGCHYTSLLAYLAERLSLQLSTSYHPPAATVHDLYVEL